MLLSIYICPRLTNSNLPDYDSSKHCDPSAGGGSGLEAVARAGGAASYLLHHDRLCGAEVAFQNTSISRQDQT